ncbi:MAG: hypothetical protein K2W95_32285 [Candidatus Obscuribacterales bacterium]|nr:hypothetical protein [Candidatus Obscuribacterales bacterium]
MPEFERNHEEGRAKTESQLIQASSILTESAMFGIVEALKNAPGADATGASAKLKQGPRVEARLNCAELLPVFFITEEVCRATLTRNSEEEPTSFGPGGQKVESLIFKVKAALRAAPPENADEFISTCALFEQALKATNYKPELFRIEAVTALKFKEEQPTNQTDKLWHSKSDGDGTESAELARAVGLVRFRYAEMLSRYGLEKQEPKFFIAAHDALMQIERLDPVLFAGSPEIKGAILQLKRGQAIDRASASAEGYINQAMERLDFPRCMPTSHCLEIATDSLALALASNHEHTIETIRNSLSTLSERDAVILKLVFTGAQSRVQKLRK